MGAKDREPRLPRYRGRSVVVLYNDVRTHQGRYCFGRTPMQTFTEARHIAREKSLLDYPEANQPTA